MQLPQKYCKCGIKKAVSFVLILFYHIFSIFKRAAFSLIQLFNSQLQSVRESGEVQVWSLEDGDCTSALSLKVQVTH